MLRAYLRSPSAVIGLVILLLALVIVIIGTTLFGHDALAVDVLSANQGPSGAHPFGTDELGRDILARIVVGTRLSLGLSLIAAAIAAVLGIPLGALSALLPPRYRSVLLRGIDTMLAFPEILIAIFIGAIIGPGIEGATLGVGIASCFSLARVTSSLALSVGGKDYMAAARVLGVSPFRTFVRYVLPNIGETLIIASTALISSCIVQISSLSFLGLGVQSPSIDWGQMLTDGVKFFYVTPVAALAPAVVIALSALAFGLVGEPLARLMNPVHWAQRVGDRPSADDELLSGQQMVDPSLSDTDLALLAAARSDGSGSADVNGSDMHGDGILDVENLVVSFDVGNRPVPVVNDVSFSLRRGDFIGIVGESGSGKTTTALAIAQLLPAAGHTTGTVALQGTALENLSARELARALGTRMSFVFQDPMSSLNPAIRIGTQLTEGTKVHRHTKHAAALAMAIKRLGEVNIPIPGRQLRRYPHELSGGMRQRVVIAMGLMNEPALLLADEPTTALDVTIQAQIMELLRRVNEEHGTSVVLISHNLALVGQNCQRVLVMYAGRIVEDLPAAALAGNALHPYTIALMSAVPQLTHSRDLPLVSIPGRAPDMTDLPTGCAFHPRCPLAVEKCRTQRPPLEARDGTHRVACWVVSGETT
jgi:oligopeptide/dipeptide ABC transporter ATP-binding protein